MNRRFEPEQEFIRKATEIIEANLRKENFGVSELAEVIGVSRSSLYLKINSITKKSVSRFISEVRLKKSMELLKQSHLTVSEIAYEVGFGSPSYFNKCFHDYYGFPPGEVKNKSSEEESKSIKSREKPLKKIIWIFSSILLVVIISITAISKHLIFIEKVPAEKSIIVLPFKNLSAEEGNLYFTDGISSDIRNQLTKISGLRVLPRTTAEQYWESTPSSPEIAKQSGVTYILDGSVQRQDKEIRISVELIDGLQDHILWSEKYDRQLADIFVIQSNIAKNVADQLQSILTPDKIKQIEKLHPKNEDAYDKYLMGQYFCLKRDSASIQKGVKYFEKAIEIDSSYSLAYAGLADGYYALSFTGNIDRVAGYDKAYKMAEKALQMDPSLAEAYAVLGVVSYFGYWKWEEARRFFEKALEVDSNCMVAHLYYCSFLDIVGEPDNALRHANRAIELEPLYHMPYQMKGVIYHNDRKYVESNNAYMRCLELNQRNWGVYGTIFNNYLYLNEEASAVQTLREFLSNLHGYQKYADKVIPVYETTGINGVFELFLDAILREGEISRRVQAGLYVRLGMQNEALNYLERACREKERDIPRMISEPEFESLHSNPRFLAMVDTMNLRPYFHKPSH